MLFEILIAIILGICSGIITGLIPGIHVNLISVLLVSSSPFLMQYFPLPALACFIIAMSVVHSFLDVIPSIYLGAPESSTALGVLPGHRYLLQGNGYMAVKLTVIGSLGALILGVALIPLLIPFVSFIYPKIQPYIGYLIALMLVYMFHRDRKPNWAVFIFFLSGVFGWVVLNTANVKNPLFPMLSGLFGVATLLYSLKETSFLPEQKIEKRIDVKKEHATRAIGASTFAGFLTSMLPGMGGAQGAVIAMQIARDVGDHGFMILMGGISTTNFVLSTVTLYSLDKARNGAIIAVQELVGKISIWDLGLYVSVALIAGGAGSFLAVYLARIFGKVVVKIKYSFLVLGVVGFIVVLTPILCGWYGLLVLLVSSMIGFLPAIVKCSRTHAMGCLLLSVLIYFL